MDPPPPPPHGNNAGNRSSGLPPGNYDIFIIPPHSSGSGFLYLPSLQPHRNSFLAGVACTLLTVAIWTVVFPVLREWFATIVASGGMGVVILLIGVGVTGWAWGKTQIEKGRPADGGSGGTSGAHTHAHANATGGPPPGSTGGMPRATGGMPGATGGMPGATGGMPGPPPGFNPGFTPPPKPTWQRANTGPGRTTGATNAGAAKSGWEKAREETRKKEEERRRAEDLKKKREDEEKERVKQRERDAREREIRERREKAAREKEAQEKEALEKEARERREKEARERRENEAREKEAKQRASVNMSRPESPTKKHQPPTAKTATEDDASASYSFRPYDKQSRKTASASSIYSESSYAPSQSTSRTTPPPSHRGPYHTKDPDKIVLKAVYSFNNALTKLPIAKLISGVGSVTDGLILRITTEGLFIDDDVRGVPQREWDVKAWTMKLVESGVHKGLHVLRASIRDQEGKRYVFVLQEEEGWKVAVGLQRLRRGTQVRALGVSGMNANEARGILENLGWS